MFQRNGLQKTEKRRKKGRGGGGLNTARKKWVSLLRRVGGRLKTEGEEEHWGGMGGFQGCLTEEKKATRMH